MESLAAMSVGCLVLWDAVIKTGVDVTAMDKFVQICFMLFKILKAIIIDATHKRHQLAKMRAWH